MTPFTAAVVVDMGTFSRYGLSQTDPHYPLEDNEQTTIQDISKRLDELGFITHPGQPLPVVHCGYLGNADTRLR